MSERHWIEVLSVLPGMAGSSPSERFEEARGGKTRARTIAHLSGLARSLGQVKYCYSCRLRERDLVRIEGEQGLGPNLDGDR